MVAQAGPRTGLSLRTATICLLLVLVGIVAACGLADHSYLVNRGKVLESSVLRTRAEDLLQDFGYSDSGFQDQDVAYGISGGGIDWYDPDPFFWYRRSPEKGSLIVNEFFAPYDPELIGRLGRISLSAPAMKKPGEIGLVLSADGMSLLWFDVVGRIPEDTSWSSGGGRSSLEQISKSLEETFGLRLQSDWQSFSANDVASAELLAKIKLSKTSPSFPGVFDHFAVFQSTGDFDDGKQVEFFAAAYRGKLVFLGPIERDERDENQSDSFWTSFVLPIQQNAWGLINLLITFVSGGLVIRNLQLGRVDRRTSFRVATAIFVACMFIWLISARHAPWTREFPVLKIGVAHAMVSAGFFLMWYVAVEPLIRRIWPDALVTWVRLISGRFSDPVVGRDLLIGVLSGLICNLILQVSILGGEALGFRAEPWPSWRMDYLQDGVSSVSRMLCWLIDGTFICSCLLALLVLLRAALRNGALAAMTQVLLIGGMFVHRETWQVDVLRESLVWGVLTFMAIRFGFLSFIIAWMSAMLLNHFSLTLNTSHFYFYRALPALIPVLGTALAGYYFTIGGRSGLRQIGLLPSR
jgi:hypothetical protein